ncbi:ATP-binding protein [Actinosynnema sp. CA-299493]
MITDETPANRTRPAELSEHPVLELVGEMPDLAGVRRWTSEALADLTEDEIADARLVVSELVTNAYQHGQHPLHLRLRRTRALIRVEVTDLSPHLPVVGRSSVRVTRGRGMVLVDRLCRRWGAVRHAVGKTVWAVLTRQPGRATTATAG